MRLRPVALPMTTLSFTLSPSFGVNTSHSTPYDRLSKQYPQSLVTSMAIIVLDVALQRQFDESVKIRNQP
eukprot:scaffold37247_cov191-Amphora_coffeaeformis.AAC.3